MTGISAIRWIGAAAVFTSLAASTLVLREPAPFDVAMMATMIFLGLFGLARPGPFARAGTICWLVITGLGLIGANFAFDPVLATKHVLISGFLAACSVTIAGFITIDPERHIALLIRAYLIASLLAAFAAIVGYFGLLPGAEALFSKYGRASGTFKDPNVLGAALVPAVLFAFHAILTRPLGRALLHAMATLVLIFAILLSFSRGAWISLLLSGLLVAYGAFVTSRRNRERLRLIVIAGAGAMIIALAIPLALQSSSVRGLMTERASLAQNYDVGHEGRFGGQAKAVDLIIGAPFGLGALTFGRRYHHEEAHNVYLSQFMNTGWLGGLAYLALVLATLAAGFRSALVPGPLQGPLIVLTAAFATTALEGLIIDSDHWRHFYLLLGALWGLVDAVGGRSRAITGWRTQPGRTAPA